MTETKPKYSSKKKGGVKLPFDFKLPFGIKLALIVALILLGAMWTITALMGFMVSTEFVRTAREANFAFNNRAASGIEDRFYKVRSEALLLLDMSAGMGENIPQLRQIRNIFFERNPNIAAVILPGVQEIINQPFFANNEIPPDALSAWLARETTTIERARVGEPVIRNVSPEVGINLLALFYPWQNTGLEEAAVIFFSPQSLSEITGAGPSTTIVVNDEGDVLIHPDFNQVLAGANISASPLFDALWKAQSESVNISFSEGGNRYVGAGQQISIASAAVFSTMEYSLINEQITAVSRRNILLSVTVLFLTVLVTWFFSRTVTTPIKKLTAAAGRLETGRLELGDLSLDLESKSRDELGILTEHFINMGRGLGRWAEIQNLVGRYNNREITDKAMEGGINLSGEYLDLVVLSAEFVTFSRDFGKQEAAESLELLNFFIAKLADCVEKNGGLVDKLIGSRVIALWGLPAPSPDMGEEVMNSIRSVLAMRAALWELNTERESQGKDPLRMSCGIHTGKVLAGCIGSGAFHEYSVSGKIIDDAVRCGNTNLITDTDIMITEKVRYLADKRILADKVNVPKSAKIDRIDGQLYGLVNLTPSQEHEKQRWPFTLANVRESLKTGKDVQKTEEPITEQPITEEPITEEPIEANNIQRPEDIVEDTNTGNATETDTDKGSTE